MKYYTDYKLIPFDYTYIIYSPDHFLSLPIAITSLLPILILVYLFSWHMVTRELEPCLFAFGHVINDLISGILKNLVKYPRPLKGRIYKNDGGLEWGMPSSHSQFMSFWFTYILLNYIINWPYYRLSKLSKIFFTIISILTVSSVVLSRILFEYHNLNQIIVGLLLGSTISTIYFILISFFREYGIFDYLLKFSIFKWWNMNDGFGRGMFNTLKKDRLEWENQIYINK